MNEIVRDYLDGVLPAAEAARRFYTTSELWGHDEESARAAHILNILLAEADEAIAHDEARGEIQAVGS